MRILLVEDEERMSEALQAILRSEKYDVDSFSNGPDGCDAAKSGIYDLMILDVMLPGMNYLSFLVSEKLDMTHILSMIGVLDAK
jgi:DNA-binding response OmpR family regulator